MNSHDNTHNDGAINGQDGRDERVDGRIEDFGEESRKMDDRDEYTAADRAESDHAEAGDARADTVEADRAEAPDEGSALTSRLEQAIRLLRREFFSATMGRDFGNRHEANRGRVDAVLEDALSDEEISSLTQSLSKIVDAFGSREEDADEGWPDPREFGRGQGFGRGFGPGFGPDFEPGFGPGFGVERGFGRGHGFGQHGFGRGRGLGQHGFGRGRGSEYHDFGSGRGSEHHDFGQGWPDQRDDRGPQQNWGPRGNWGPRDEWDEATADEGRFDRRRGHGRQGADGSGPDHLGPHHRVFGRRRGMGKMVGAAFERGFAAGYQRGVRS